MSGAAPALPKSVALAQAVGARVKALEASQWQPAAQLAQMQFAALGRLAAFANTYSPFFHRRLAAAGLSPDDLARPAGFAALPPMERRALQRAADIFSKGVPPAHHPLNRTQTSGSTGEPVTVVRTRVNNLDWLALTMRDYTWHGADFARPLAVVRANIPGLSRNPDWGAPASLLRHTGPSIAIPIALSAAEIFALLEEVRPGNLLAYPGTLRALVDHAVATGARLEGLKAIRSIGETLSPELRTDARNTFGAPVTDVYSAQEVGYIALECPDSGLYHTMAETMIVEVLKDDGTPCAPGETGRVVLTDLRNLATPLIRYAIGDHAEAAAPCPCGRGLPTLKRILGRERNLILMRDGTRHWPLVGFHRFREIAPVSQYQMIQRTPEEIEVRLVTERPLTPQEEQGLTQRIQTSLGHPFRLSFVYFPDRLPIPASGKFEEFMSLV
ncbi:MAG: phenylacetate--CoA ligase family protein [Alphaproteobacteria bacterium]|nr:phenylacetate--CoA ligase family protein [Alphaproteobacteria bacterium]